VNFKQCLRFIRTRDPRKPISAAIRAAAEHHPESLQMISAQRIIYMT